MDRAGRSPPGAASSRGSAVVYSPATPVLSGGAPTPNGSPPPGEAASEAPRPKLGAAVMTYLREGMRAFETLQELGRGSFGKALLVRHVVDGFHYVIKQVDIRGMDAGAKKAALGEVAVLSQLSHPNIIGYYGSFIDAAAGTLNIVLEYADAGDLAETIKAAAAARRPFPEHVILGWFCQLASALRYVHSRRILHRDLKASNILLATADRVVKVGDFGISRVLEADHSLARTVIGTPYNMSPELCNNVAYSYKSDVWALGCVLYEMATLRHAFDASNMCALVMRILSTDYPPVDARRYSPGLRRLIAGMLQLDPASRPSMQELIDDPVVQSSLRAQVSAEGAMGCQLYEEALQRRGSSSGAAAGVTADAGPFDDDDGGGGSSGGHSHHRHRHHHRHHRHHHRKHGTESHGDHVSSRTGTSEDRGAPAAGGRESESATFPEGAETLEDVHPRSSHRSGVASAAPSSRASSGKRPGHSPSVIPAAAHDTRNAAAASSPPVSRSAVPVHAAAFGRALALPPAPQLRPAEHPAVTRAKRASLVSVPSPSHVPAQYSPLGGGGRGDGGPESVLRVYLSATGGGDDDAASRFLSGSHASGVSVGSGAREAVMRGGGSTDVSSAGLLDAAAVGAGSAALQHTGSPPQVSSGRQSSPGDGGSSISAAPPLYSARSPAAETEALRSQLTYRGSGSAGAADDDGVCVSDASDAAAIAAAVVSAQLRAAAAAIAEQDLAVQTLLHHSASQPSLQTLAAVAAGASEGGSERRPTARPPHHTYAPRAAASHALLREADAAVPPRHDAHHARGSSLGSSSLGGGGGGGASSGGEGDDDDDAAASALGVVAGEAAERRRAERLRAGSSASAAVADRYVSALSDAASATDETAPLGVHEGEGGAGYDTDASAASGRVGPGGPLLTRRSNGDALSLLLAGASPLVLVPARGELQPLPLDSQDGSPEALGRLAARRPDREGGDALYIQLAGTGTAALMMAGRPSIEGATTMGLTAALAGFRVGGSDAVGHDPLAAAAEGPSGSASGCPLVIPRSTPDASGNRKGDRAIPLDSHGNAVFGATLAPGQTLHRKQAQHSRAQAGVLAMEAGMAAAGWRGAEAPAADVADAHRAVLRMAAAQPSTGRHAAAGAAADSARRGQRRSAAVVSAPPSHSVARLSPPPSGVVTASVSASSAPAPPSGAGGGEMFLAPPPSLAQRRQQGVGLRRGGAMSLAPQEDNGEAAALEIVYDNNSSVLEGGVAAAAPASDLSDAQEVAVSVPTLPSVPPQRTVSGRVVRALPRRPSGAALSVVPPAGSETARSSRRGSRRAHGTTATTASAAVADGAVVHDAALTVQRAAEAGTPPPPPPPFLPPPLPPPPQAFVSDAGRQRSASAEPPARASGLLYSSDAFVCSPSADVLGSRVPVAAQGASPQLLLSPRPPTRPRTSRGTPQDAASAATPDWGSPAASASRNNTPSGTATPVRTPAPGSSPAIRPHSSGGSAPRSGAATPQSATGPRRRLPPPAAAAATAAAVARLSPRKATASPATSPSAVGAAVPAAGTASGGGAMRRVTSPALSAGHALARSFRQRAELLYAFFNARRGSGGRLSGSAAAAGSPLTVFASMSRRRSSGANALHDPVATGFDQEPSPAEATFGDPRDSFHADPLASSLAVSSRLRRVQYMASGGGGDPAVASFRTEGSLPEVGHTAADVAAAAGSFSDNDSSAGGGGSATEGDQEEVLRLRSESEARLPVSRASGSGGAEPVSAPGASVALQAPSEGPNAGSGTSGTLPVPPASGTGAMAPALLQQLRGAPAGQRASVGRVHSSWELAVVHLEIASHLQDMISVPPLPPQPQGAAVQDAQLPPAAGSHFSEPVAPLLAEGHGSRGGSYAGDSSSAESPAGSGRPPLLSQAAQYNAEGLRLPHSAATDGSESACPVASPPATTPKAVVAPAAAPAAPAAMAGHVHGARVGVLTPDRLPPAAAPLSNPFAAPHNAGRFVGSQWAGLVGAGASGNAPDFLLQLGASLGRDDHAGVWDAQPPPPPPPPPRPPTQSWRALSADELRAALALPSPVLAALGRPSLSTSLRAAPQPVPTRTRGGSGGRAGGGALLLSPAGAAAAAAAAGDRSRPLSPRQGHRSHRSLPQQALQLQQGAGAAGADSVGSVAAPPPPPLPPPSTALARPELPLRQDSYFGADDTGGRSSLPQQQSPPHVSAGSLLRHESAPPNPSGGGLSSRGPAAVAVSAAAAAAAPPPAALVDPSFNIYSRVPHSAGGGSEQSSRGDAAGSGAESRATGASSFNEAYAAAAAAPVRSRTRSDGTHLRQQRLATAPPLLPPPLAAPAGSPARAAVASAAAALPAVPTAAASAAPPALWSPENQPSQSLQPAADLGAVAAPSAYPAVQASGASVGGQPVHVQRRRRNSTGALLTASIFAAPLPPPLMAPAATGGDLVSGAAPSVGSVGTGSSPAVATTTPWRPGLAGPASTGGDASSSSTSTRGAAVGFPAALADPSAGSGSGSSGGRLADPVAALEQLAYKARSLRALCERLLGRATFADAFARLLASAGDSSATPPAPFLSPSTVPSSASSSAAPTAPAPSSASHARLSAPEAALAASLGPVMLARLELLAGLLASYRAAEARLLAQYGAGGGSSSSPERSLPQLQPAAGAGAAAASHSGSAAGAAWRPAGGGARHDGLSMRRRLPTDGGGWDAAGSVPSARLPAVQQLQPPPPPPPTATAGKGPSAELQPACAAPRSYADDDGILGRSSNSSSGGGGMPAAFAAGAAGEGEADELSFVPGGIFAAGGSLSMGLELGGREEGESESEVAAAAGGDWVAAAADAGEEAAGAAAASAAAEADGQALVAGNPDPDAVLDRAFAGLALLSRSMPAALGGPGERRRVAAAASLSTGGAAAAQALPVSPPPTRSLVH